MKQIKQHFITIYQAQPDLIGLIAIDNPYPYMKGMDLLLLVLSEKGSDNETGYVQMSGQCIIIRKINFECFNRWSAVGENRSIIQWIIRGEILLDRSSYLSNMRERLMLFPDDMKEQRRFSEFSGFLNTYLKAKHDLDNHNVLDAHSHILAALHHWAQLVLIEEGYHPEESVWRQIRLVHPGVYKLYEELAASPETLEQRVRLVMLACEFTVMNKMKECCSLLFHILKSRQEPWSIHELQEHPSIGVLQVDLLVIVQNLVKRSYIREIATIPANGDPEAIELRYMLMAV